MKNEKNLIWVALLFTIIIIITIFIVIKFSKKEDIPKSDDTISNTNSEIGNTANSNNTSTQEYTISYILSKFEELGITVSLEEKPYYSMIGAIDGVLFYIDNNPVKLYAFENEKSYTDALDKYPILKNMPKKGLVVLDTNLSNTIEIFNSL